MRRQPDFSTVPRPSRFKSLERVAVVIGIVSLLFALGFAWQARSEAAQAAARLATTRAEAESYATQVRAFTRSGAAGDKIASATPTRIAASVASALPDHVRLERLAIEYGATVSLEMNVIARRAAEWDLLLERLEKSPEFGEVQPGPESRQAEVRSTVRARWTRVAP